MTFDDWCNEHGVYLNDKDSAAKAARLMARRAWFAALETTPAAPVCAGTDLLRVVTFDEDGSPLTHREPTLDELRDAIVDAAVAAERERCARIVEDMVRMVDGADALAAIRGA